MGRIIDAIRRFREEDKAEAGSENSGAGGSSELPAMMTRRQMLERLEASAFGEVNPYRFPLGVAADGVLEWDTERDSHLVVAGTSARGKSVTQLGIACHALEHPCAWRIYAIDPKRVEFGHLAGYATLRVAQEPEDIRAALREVVAEMERRFAEMEAARVGHIRELDPQPKRILLVVDEIAEVLTAEEAEANRASLERIAALGRAAGVHVVLATQRPTEAKDGDITVNATSRLACGRMDRASSEAVVGSGAAEHLPALSGRAIYRSGAEDGDYAEQEVQLALASVSDLPEPSGDSR